MGLGNTVTRCQCCGIYIRTWDKTCPECKAKQSEWEQGQRVTPQLTCPECHGKNLRKNGLANSKQRWLCKNCGLTTNYPVGEDAPRRKPRKVLQRQ